jgi:hypothetical protein
MYHSLFGPGKTTHPNASATPRRTDDAVENHRTFQRGLRGVRDPEVVGEDNRPTDGRFQQKVDSHRDLGSISAS